MISDPLDLQRTEDKCGSNVKPEAFRHNNVDVESLDVMFIVTTARESYSPTLPGYRRCHLLLVKQYKNTQKNTEHCSKLYATLANSLCISLGTIHPGRRMGIWRAETVKTKAVIKRMTAIW